MPKPDPRLYGEKNSKGEIISTPTHSIVSDQRLPLTGFISEPVGGGFFVRYTASDSKHVILDMRKAWQQKPTKASKKIKPIKDQEND